jgi:uncharacterized protein YpmB
MNERIEYIQELQEKVYESTKKQSIIINNFYSIITIIIVCVAIIFYTVYIIPAQDAKKQREENIIKQERYQLKRAKEIALSHKLNQPKEVTKNDKK